MAAASASSVNPRWNDFMLKPYPFNSAASPPTCSTDCPTCSDFYRPSESISANDGIQPHDDMTAAAQTRDLVRQTKADLDYVRNGIVKFGDQIIEAWKADGSINARIELLQAAKPDIYPHKHADVDIALAPVRRAHQPDRKKKRVDVFLFKHASTRLVPYIDQETFSKDYTRLLALMYYRAFFNPCDWVTFDGENLLIDFHACELPISWNPHCVVMYGDAFGTLVQWGEAPAHRLDIWGYPLALLVLKAQSQISSFLRRMMELLLQIQCEEGLEDTRLWHQLIDSSFRSENGAIKQSTFYDPFSAVPTFDAQDLFKLFLQQQQAAEDEIETLQTDAVHTWHALKMLRKSTTYRIVNDDELRQFMLFDIMFGSLFQKSTWLWLSVFAKQLVVLAEDYQGKICAGAVMPEDYFHAQARLEAILTIERDEMVYRLHYLAFQDSWSHRRFVHGGRLPEDMHKMFRDEEEKLFVGLSVLFPENPSIRLETSSAFRFIEEHLVCTKTGKNRLDEKRHNFLADFAAVCQALQALKLHRPRRGCDLTVEQAQSVLMKSEQGLKYLLVRNFRGGYKEIQPQVLKALLKFADSRKDAKDLQSLYTDFWKQVQVAMKAKFEHLPCSDIMELFLHADLAPTLESEQEQSRKQESNHQDSKAQKELGAKEQHDWQLPKYYQSTTSEEKLVTIRRKEKVKTRPTAVNAPEGLDAAAAVIHAVVEPINTALRIGVSAQSLQTFDTIFKCPIHEAGKLRRDDLVRAMVDAGCQAVNTFGTQWRFTDVRNHQGSLLVHLPHEHIIEGAKFSYLRKRLQKRLNWDEDTFELQKS